MAVKDAVQFLENLKADRVFRDRFVSLQGNVIAFQSALKAAGLQFAVNELTQALHTVTGLSGEVEPLLNDLQNASLGYLPVVPSVAEDDDPDEHDRYIRQWQAASPR